VRDGLLIAGFRPAEAERRLALFRQVENAVAVTGGFGSAALLGYHVPGRIEVLGKHTDYAGGRSLVCATERGFAVLAAPRADDCLTLLDVRSGERRVVTIRPDLESVRGDWVNYAITVARRLARDFGPGLAGADIAFASDLPLAAGVSSSSALVVSIALVLRDRNRLGETEVYRRNIRSPIDLGDYLGAVENGRSYRGLDGGGGVGTMGGSQDQTAILISRPDALAQIRFRPVGLERMVPMPPNLTFVIAASGVEAAKAGAALTHYNGLATLTTTLAEALEATGGATLGNLLLERGPLAPDAATRLFEWPDPVQGRRLRGRLAQLAAECRMIIPGVGDALANGNLRLVGELVRASQDGAEIELANQVPETVALVESAAAGGAVAASAFGAGFGGSVWALVPTDTADRFTERWRTDYLDRFPERAGGARFFQTRPAPPAVRLENGHGAPAA